MIWTNGYTKENIVRLKKEIKDKEIKKLEEWHKWFAWFPIVVDITKDKREVKAWLCFVERKGTFYVGTIEDWWNWEYRISHQDSKN